MGDTTEETCVQKEGWY